MDIQKSIPRMIYQGHYTRKGNKILAKVVSERLVQMKEESPDIYYTEMPGDSTYAEVVV